MDSLYQQKPWRTSEFHLNFSLPQNFLTRSSGNSRRVWWKFATGGCSPQVWLDENRDRAWREWRGLENLVHQKISRQCHHSSEIPRWHGKNRHFGSWKSLFWVCLELLAWLPNLNTENLHQNGRKTSSKSFAVKINKKIQKVYLKQPKTFPHQHFTTPLLNKNNTYDRCCACSRTTLQVFAPFASFLECAISKILTSHGAHGVVAEWHFNTSY